MQLYWRHNHPFVTLMGLIGYINDEIQRRSKEIAIRKVNGAGVIHSPAFLEGYILDILAGRFS